MTGAQTSHETLRLELKPGDQGLVKGSLRHATNQGMVHIQIPSFHRAPNHQPDGFLEKSRHPKGEGVASIPYLSSISAKSQNGLPENGDLQDSSGVTPSPPNSIFKGKAGDPAAGVGARTRLPAGLAGAQPCTAPLEPGRIHRIEPI